MTEKCEVQPVPQDVRDIMAALRRAARRAREEAIRTGTCLVIVRDGKIVHVPPSEFQEEMDRQARAERDDTILA